MTILVAILAVLVVALVVLAVISGRKSEQAGADLVMRFAREEHGRAMMTAEQTRQLLETFGYRLTDVSLRESEDIKVLLRAGIDERRMLLTALLSTSTDTRVAQRFGLVEQATRRPDVDAAPSDARAFLDQILAEQRDRPDSELVDDDGRPIIPVGMSGG